MLNHRHRIRLVCSCQFLSFSNDPIHVHSPTESFLDAFNIIIFSSARLCPLQQAAQHHLFRCREINHHRRQANLTHSQYTINRVDKETHTVSSNLSAWSILRGNPSIKNRPRPFVHPSPVFLSFNTAPIAFSNNLIVTSIGTIVPSRMHVLIKFPYSDPWRFCSARKRSPAVRGIL